MTDSASRPREVTPALLGMMLAAVLVPLNSTMIAVALPEIADDLEVSTGTTGVLVVVYLAIMLVGQPLAGRLGDGIGYRRSVVVGLAGVGAASLLAAAVTSFPALVAIRGSQAVFAAMLIPNVQAAIRATTEPARRGKIFGLFGSMIGVGAALGPLVGGVVTGLAGWQAVFLVNLPIVVVAMWLIRGAPEPAVEADVPVVEKGGSGRVWNRSFVGAFTTQGLTTFGQYTLILVVPAMLDERGWSTGAVGAALTALTIGMVAMGPVGGSYGDRHGRRRPAAIGVATAASAMCVAALGGPSIAAALLVVVLLAYGFGFGFAAPSLMTTAVESAPPERTATASGLFSTSRYAGSIPASVGFAIVIGDTVSDGVRTLLIASAVCALAAVATSSLLPERRPAAEVSGAGADRR